MVSDGNSFLGLHSHHVCNGKPPDKAVAFLMAKKIKLSLIKNNIMHFSVSILMLNSEHMVFPKGLDISRQVKNLKKVTKLLSL